MNGSISGATATISLDKTASPLGPALKEGGFVFVRVLAQSEGGALVSFGGRRFEVRTQRSLQPGTGFKAQIKLEGNTVKLVPVEASAVRGEAAGSAASLSRMLQAAGLAPQAEVVKMLQYALENETGFSAEKLRKLRKKIQASANKDAAAEIAAYFADKGIDADEGLIEQLLLLLDLRGKPASQAASAGQGGKSGTFLDGFYDNALQALAARATPFTAANHLGGENAHWLILPFEKRLANEDWSGTIRMRLGTKSRCVTKLYVNAKNEQKGLIFEIFPPKNRHKRTRQLRIKFAQQPEASPAEQARLKRLLAGCFPPEEFELSAEYDQLVERQYFVDSEVCVKGVDESV